MVAEPLHRAVEHGRVLVSAVRNKEGQRRTVVRRYLAHALFPSIRRLSPYVAVRGPEATYLIDTRDDTIGRSTFRRGSYDQAAMDEAVALLGTIMDSASPLAGRALIDVGANIGITSVPAVRRYGAERVVAYEADPGNVRLLRCNLILNDLDARVEVVHAAVTDTAGSVVLELSESNLGDHRVRRTARAGQYGEEHRRTVTVPAVTLQDDVGRVGLRPADVALLWIDTQGHEGHVLHGAGPLLAAGVPVHFEFWPYGLDRADGFDLLADALASYTRLFDVRSSLASGRPEPVRSLSALRTTLDGTDWTDVLALP